MSGSHHKFGKNKSGAFVALLDRTAVGLAVICAIHCLLLPVLLVVLPILGTSFWASENFHLWMVFLVMPTTLAAVFMGCRKHKDRWVAGLSAIGLVVLLVAFFVGHGATHLGVPHTHSHGAHGHSHTEIGLEAILMTVAGAFLASAHFRNFRLCRRDDCDHDLHED